VKLLFDENLAPRLASALSDLYPGSLHIGDFGLRGASDAEVWQYARDSGFVIVSKDSYFRREVPYLAAHPKWSGYALATARLRAPISCCATWPHECARFYRVPKRAALFLAGGPGPISNKSGCPMSGFSDMGFHLLQQPRQSARQDGSHISTIPFDVYYNVMQVVPNARECACSDSYQFRNQR
jgi:hypothetical protein